MGRVIAGMTVSLDGFVHDRNGGMGALYADFETLLETELMQQSIANTGAVIMGWNTFAKAPDVDSYADDYEYQVPIFVVTRTPPQRHPRESERVRFTFVTDGVERAVEQAKAAAGSKDVTIVGGPTTVQQCLNAGLVDELQLDVMPVLLGDGLRMLESLATDHIRLERANVQALPAGRTHLSFRVRRDT